MSGGDNSLQWMVQAEFSSVFKPEKTSQGKEKQQSALGGGEKKGIKRRQDNVLQVNEDSPPETVG